MTMKFHFDGEVFDPFKTFWIPKTWHPKIELQPAPSTSRVFGTEIRGGDCCVWKGAKNLKGYGRVTVGKRQWLLHRYTFSMVNDVDLSPVDFIDHLCRCRPCFNPYHHDCTTALENFIRGDGPLYRFQSREKIREQVEEIPF